MVFKSKKFHGKYCFIISIWLFFFDSNNQGRNYGREFWNLFSPRHACCLLGYTRPRKPTNESSNNQNAGFSIWVFKKKFLSGRGLSPARSVAGSGASTLVLGPHAGYVFVPRDLDLWRSDLKINGFATFQDSWWNISVKLGNYVILAASVFEISCGKQTDEHRHRWEPYTG